jgi:hypothetical protein
MLFDIIPKKKLCSKMENLTEGDSARWRMREIGSVDVYFGENNEEKKGIFNIVHGRKKKQVKA